MDLPVFTPSLPGLVRSIAIRLAPQDDYILNPMSWWRLFQVVGQWLRQYLQNIALPVLCGMVKMVENDFEQAVVVILTYDKGRSKQVVTKSVAASLLRFAGPPVDGYAVLGDWASLKWGRELNRHVQRRFGLGDVFAVQADMGVDEASRALYGLGGHRAFLEGSGVFLRTLFALAPAEPPLALEDRAPECEHYWVSLPSSGHRLYPDGVLEARLSFEQTLRTLSRTGVAVLRDLTVSDLVREFVAGTHMAFASCCEACCLSANTYCRCSRCGVIWCSACLSGQRLRTLNREQPLALREEGSREGGPLAAPVTNGEHFLRDRCHLQQRGASGVVPVRVAEARGRRGGLGGGGWAFSQVPRGTRQEQPAEDCPGALRSHGWHPLCG